MGQGRGVSWCGGGQAGTAGRAVVPVPVLAHVCPPAGHPSQQTSCRSCPRPLQLSIGVLEEGGEGTGRILVPSAKAKVKIPRFLNRLLGLPMVSLALHRRTPAPACQPGGGQAAQRHAPPCRPFVRARTCSLLLPAPPAITSSTRPRTHAQAHTPPYPLLPAFLPACLPCALPQVDQELLFQYFQDTLDATVAQLKSEGKFDSGIVTIKVRGRGHAVGGQWWGVGRGREATGHLAAGGAAGAGLSPGAWLCASPGR